MNNRRSRALPLTALVLASSIALLGQRGPGPGNGRGMCPWCNRGAADAVPAEPLTSAEIQWLVQMREEEKMARDVYLSLYNTWKLNVFSNIARSEERHFDAIGVQLARYNVVDPALAEPGKFTSPVLQTLYNKLLAKGVTSLKAALEVGVDIEEQDIKDLETAMQETTKTDIDRVYTNLLAGSLNHLDAFKTHLEIAASNP